MPASVAIVEASISSTGPSWLVHKDEDAILTPIDDVDAFAEGIRRVIGSKALAQKLVAAGRRRVAEEFSESAIVRRYIELFEKVRR